MEKWIGKVALVTGASAGIGKDISIRLGNAGVKVFGCGRNLDKLNDVKNEVKGEFVPVQCDVQVEAEVVKMFEFIKKEAKDLSICINNAGASFKGSILNCEVENMRKMVDLNVIGLCVCTREAYKMMQLNEGREGFPVPGHIINICSMAGHRCIPSSFHHFYSATKFAVKAITESTRLELRESKSNIKISQISPGLTETEFQIRSVGQEALQEIKKHIPNPLTASDISDAIIAVLSLPPYANMDDILMRPNQAII